MTSGRKVNTSSQSWNTPPDIVEIVNKCFGGEISLDPCSNENSVVGATHSFTKDDNGLVQDWANYENIFVNPPYGKGISDWLEKCASCSEHQSVIALIPVAVNTSHWKKHILNKNTAIAFLNDTRPKFWMNGHPIKKGAPMACCLVHWGKGRKLFIDNVKQRCNVVIPL